MELRKRKEKIDKEIQNYWQDVEKDKMKDYDAKTRAKLEKEYVQRQENAKSISD